MSESKTIENVEAAVATDARERDVSFLYDVLLERAPDPDGMRSCLQYLSSGESIRLRDLAIVIMRSPEFASKNPTKVTEQISADLVSTTMNGVDLLVPSRDAVYDVSLKSGCYEGHVARAITEVLNPGSVFMDVGANIGVHSQLASEICGSAGIVYAIDASIENCNIHEMSLRKFARDNVIVVPVALSGNEAVEHILVDPRTSNKFVRNDKSDMVSSRPLLTFRLDQLMTRVNRLDLIKIDVEGRELDVLSGASGLIQRFSPPIIAEWIPSSNEAFGSGFPTFLQSLGYRLSVIEQTGEKCPIGDVAGLKSTWQERKKPGVDHLDLFFSR